MHTSKDDYMINTLRFVSRKEVSEKYGAVLPECLTSLAMKESKAYKTYLGFAIGVVPPKAVRKFKKASPSKKDNVPIPKDEEPVKKGKRLKIAAKKSAYKLVTGIVIREPVVIRFAEDPPSVAKITPPVTSEGTSNIPGVPDVTNDNSS
ncbi:hypothetical protein Tco_0800375 [Tanacetum coccineum]|uniref:Uncharacterized protein n=1 Tax=Tanacetum coccineum TaxID=301880 RepID=A0ABQ4ZTY2_9ASTR